MLGIMKLCVYQKEGEFVNSKNIKRPTGFTKTYLVTLKHNGNLDGGTVSIIGRKETLKAVLCSALEQTVKTN